MENDLYLKNEEFYAAYDAVYMLRSDSVVRSVDIAGAVTDFKMGLISAFCEICPGAQIIDAAELQQIAASQTGLDIVYPSIGDNLDNLFRVRDNHGVALHLLKRPEDVFSWHYAKRGFFNFKKHIPDILSFLR